MAKETEKKGIGWFKSVRSNQNQLESNYAVEAEINADVEETEQIETNTGNQLLSKNTNDKTVLDLIVALENMLKDRQLVLYKNKGLEEQLLTANDMIIRLKQEQMKKEQILQEKNKEIRTLEISLTNKQMSYDQILEDYKEYQNKSNFEYEKVLHQLEAENNKYKKLFEESTNSQYQSMIKINELEDKVRGLEIENQKYLDQYQRIIDEKAELMQTINDFTERMSFSFAPKKTVHTVPDSE